MTLRRALAALAAALALAGCGGDDGGSDTKTTDSPGFPPVTINESGDGVVPVADKEEAKRLCLATQKKWPKEYELYEQVTFDVPATTNDVYCAKID